MNAKNNSDVLDGSSSCSKANTSLLSTLRSVPSNQLPNTNTSHFDILVTLLSIQIQNNRQSVELIVADQSLQSHEMCRIQLYNLNTKDINKCIEMRKGDMVRFNGISIKKRYDTINDVIENELEHDIEKFNCCVMDLHYSFKDLHSESTFCKVASGYGEQVIMEADVPSIFQTDRNVLKELRWWFVHSKYYRVEVPDTNYCRRQLKELTKPNLLSDVNVRILSIDRDESWTSRQGHSRWKGGEYTRLLLEDCTQYVLPDSQFQQESFGTSSSEQETLPLYVSNQNPLLKIMREYHRSRIPFTLRRVLTERMKVWSDEIISDIFMVLTKHTTIQQLVYNFDKDSLTQTQSAKRKRGESTSLFEVDEHGFVNQKLDSKESKCAKTDINEKEKISLTGYIASISFDGQILFGESNKIWPCYDEFVNVITSVNSNGDRTFKDASITLCENETNLRKDICANEFIISTLLGDCDAISIANKNADREAYSYELLQDLITLEVPLEWTLKIDNCTLIYEATSVFLESL